MTVHIEPIEIGKESYFTVSQFASIINKSEQTVYNLIRKGNCIRKLKCLRIAGKSLIFSSELTTFPFTFAGSRARDHIYHYDKNGKVVVPKGADKK